MTWGQLCIDPLITTMMKKLLFSKSSKLVRRYMLKMWASFAGSFHQNTRETPLLIYVGLVVHARTRKCDFIVDLGLSISYDRVMEICTTISNHVCNYYQQNEVVCPPNLLEGLFTTAAIDNIDHNPSSTTATDALHVTGISLFHHPRNYGDGCECREHHVLVLKSATKKLSELPQSYTNVRPLNWQRRMPQFQKWMAPWRVMKLSINITKWCQVSRYPNFFLFHIARDNSVCHNYYVSLSRWLKTVEERYLQTVDSDGNISREAFYANQQPAQDNPPAITAMLPLFHEDSKSCCHDTSLNGCDLRSCARTQPQSSTSDYIGSQPLYSITKSNKVNIDEARQELFTMKGRAMDAIPPNRAALLQHIKRPVHQGGHCWGKMLQVTIGMPPPGDWGWVDPQNWRPK